MTVAVTLPYVPAVNCSRRLPLALVPQVEHPLVADLL